MFSAGKYLQSTPRRSNMSAKDDWSDTEEGIGDVLLKDIPSDLQRRVKNTFLDPTPLGHQTELPGPDPPGTTELWTSVYDSPGGLHASTVSEPGEITGVPVWPGQEIDSPSEIPAEQFKFEI